MIKIRNNPDIKNSDEFLKEMVDKPYGTDDRLERVTISMKGQMFDRLDTIVRTRKRAKQLNRTMSALIIEAVEFYLKNHK